MYPTQPVPFQRWLVRELARLGVDEGDLAARSGLAERFVRWILVGARPSTVDQRAQMARALDELEREIVGQP